MTWKDSNDDAAVPAPLGPSLSATCYSSTAHASPRDSHSLPPSCPMSASRCCPSRPSMSCVTSKPYALKSLPSSIACHASAHCRGSACGCGRQYAMPLLQDSEAWVLEKCPRSVHESMQARGVFKQLHRREKWAPCEGLCLCLAVSCLVTDGVGHIEKKHCAAIGFAFQPLPPHTGAPRYDESFFADQ